MRAKSRRSNKSFCSHRQHQPSDGQRFYFRQPYFFREMRGLEEKDFEQMLQKVSTLEGVISAYVCSRAGNYVMGNTPKYADRNMYSAITSRVPEPSSRQMNGCSSSSSIVMVW